MEAQATGHAVGDDVAHLCGGHEPVKSPDADAELHGELLPRESLSALLVPQGGLQRTRRKQAREIVQWDPLLSSVLGLRGAGPRRGKEQGVITTDDRKGERQSGR